MSIFYHFIDAKRRLPDGLDDFSLWLMSFGDKYQELIHQIRNLDPYFFTLPELKKELGDMLLHILFHTDLAREEGHFSLKEVIDAECDKLIYRHPHVFGNTKVDDAEHVSRNWEQLKRREKGRNSVLDGVPVSLPALQRAARIQEKASKVGFDWTNSKSVWKKVREEVFEFEAELTSLSSERGGRRGVESRKAEEFGDLLFSLVHLARHEHIDPEAALERN